MTINKRLVAGLMVSILVWGGAGTAGAASGTNSVGPQAGCSLSATRPYGTSSGKVAFAAKRTGCTNILDVWLMWAAPGPDQTMSTKKNATSETTYYRVCDWWAPAERELYTWAQVRGDGAEAITSTRRLTNVTTDCKI